MYIDKINKQTFGVSYSEIFVKTMNHVKNQKPEPKRELTLKAQLLMRDEFFKCAEICDSVKASYFAFLNKI